MHGVPFTGPPVTVKIPALPWKLAGFQLGNCPGWPTPVTRGTSQNPQFCGLDQCVQLTPLPDPCGITRVVNLDQNWMIWKFRNWQAKLKG